MKFTIKELQEFYNSKNYITEERFFVLFNIRKGMDLSTVKEWYKIFMNFPLNIRIDQNVSEINTIMKVISEYINERQNAFSGRFPYDFEKPERFIKIYYKEKESEIINDIELNLFNSEDVLTYADLIKRTEIILCLPLVDEYYLGREKKYLRFYEGDVYHSKDDFWSNKKGNVYIASNKSFKRLNYIKGVGYLDNNEKPNYDGSEGSFSSYAITGYKYEKMGNIYLDINFLKD